MCQDVSPKYRTIIRNLIRKVYISATIPKESLAIIGPMAAFFEEEGHTMKEVYLPITIEWPQQDKPKSIGKKFM